MGITRLPEHHASIAETFREVRQYFTAEDRQQWLYLIVISLLTGATQALILKLFNDAAVRHASGGTNLPQMFLLLGLVVTGIATGYVGSMRGTLVSTRTAVRFRNRLLDEIEASNLRLVERIGPSVLHYHLMDTIGKLAGSYGNFMNFISSSVMLTCLFVYIGSLSFASLLCAIVVTCVGIGVHLRYEKINLEHRIRADRLSNESSMRHRETIDGYKELRMSRSKTADYRARVDRNNENLSAASLRVTRVSVVADLSNNFFQFLLIFIMIFGLPLLVKLDGIVMLQMMGAIFITMGPLSGVVNAIPDFNKIRVALMNIKALQHEMAATRESPLSEHARASLPPFQSIELRNIEFRFENQASDEGFRLGAVNLTVRRGEVLFIVGGNGSGKTVLLRLLTGLYHHSRGEILFNGRPLEAADRQSYRELFSTVFSDFHLFSEILGVPRLDESVVNYWIERLDLAGKVSIVDGAFTTIALSAGQRKRLAYLLCILEDRPIVVLDEFGAEQDPENRRRFYLELLPDLQRRGKTVIAVTHDDAYFHVADRTLKMDYGKIVSDTHAADTPNHLVRL